MKKRSIIAIILIIALLMTIPAYASSTKAKKVAKIAVKQLGKPYSVLSDPPDDFNCYTLVKYCCNSVKSNTISANGINGSYAKIQNKADLQVGDIVCYKITSGRTPKIMNYHFGIYCGKGYFIHACSSKGVIYSKVNSYSGKYLGGLRVF